MLPKRKRVERRDRPRAHGKNIAQNAADAGGRALIGLDERRMIVAFHLESHRQAIADIDHAGILTRPLQNMRAFRRETFQIMARALVAAMLRPHNGKDAELRIVRLAAENLDDLLILFRRQTVAGDQLRRHRGWLNCGAVASCMALLPSAHAAAMDEKILRRPRYRGVCCRHLPDEALGRRRCALHCTRPRCYPASRWDWPTGEALPLAST